MTRASEQTRLVPSSATRIPRAPYPGLRPFLPYEEILLFGRERQVREVIAKLQETQFVAVIGGSGSGKSSLVLAGVVPELRAFGIPGAGDFWVPMVCTPGTNANKDDDEKGLNTPITRLARKFAALLRSRGSAEKDDARLEEIAARLREELGFAHLVELYSHELAAQPGPDPQDARFLFVIDQFEELFHPTTRQSKDASLLVERVIDHFFSPHPRCYIVLTMRSEHLNDCAGFLELPDAINKSSYLVRRLDDDELKDAISKPPRRLLRLKKLADEATARLPHDVEFDEAVISRLVSDARKISDDPDHLPLLQHALARTWQAASERLAGQLDLPDRLTIDDLSVAACGSAENLATGLAEGVNVLRASVEYWAEAAYKRHIEQEQQQLNLLLPSLGVRDPNTGMYSQQRVQVAEFAPMLGPGKTADDLKKLVAEGFLGEVNYLYWDDDDPQRITLKVSHESLIRGWARLRNAIDVEAERFEEFVGLLRKCDKWSRNRCEENQLLEENDLRRIDQETLGPILADPKQRQAWFGRLGSTAAYEGLGKQDDAVDEFVRQSRLRLQRSKDLESRRKRNRKFLLICIVLLLPPAFYFGLVQGPLYSRTELLMASSVQATRYVPERQPGVGSQAPTLKILLDAAANIDRARQGTASWDQGVNHALLDALADVPYFRGRAALFNRAAAISDSTVNTKLRRLLTSAAWRTSWPKKISQDLVVKPATIKSKVRCGYEPEGKLLSLSFGQGLTRMLFLPKPPDMARDPEVRLYTATVAANQDSSSCELMQIFTPNSGFESVKNPALVFDAQLRYFWVVDNQINDAATATMFEIDSVLLNMNGLRRSRIVRRIQISGAKDISSLKDAITSDGWSQVPSGAVLPTMRMKAGRALKVGDDAWRLVDSFAQPRLDKASFRDLGAAAEGSACARLGDILRKRLERGEQLMMQQDKDDRTNCFATYMRTEESSFLASVGVEVYAMPSREELDEEQLSSPLAMIERFTRAPLQGGAKPDIKWSVGTGIYAGWLQSEFKDIFGNPYTAAAPWSTCALYRFGHEVLRTEPESGICVGR
jgi:energy-coupling factor transporter ATP-binding protein EcfA2